MQILIAPDSFKNALPAREVAVSLKKGIEKVIPDARIIILPQADGGEGTVEAVIDATKGTLHSVRVHDPFMRVIESSFGITGDGKTAVLEMASASGIQLVSESERDPWISTSYGTGELIRAALDKGCRTLLLGIGGSATNDCGTGMASALGAQFLDRDKQPVNPGGGALADVDSIDLTGLDPRLKETEILVACDVTNPLTGPEGASFVYGPQKGAGPEMVKKLDANLKAFSLLIEDQLGMGVDGISGAGAAGGLGAGLIAFLGGKLVEGFPVIAEITGLAGHIRDADLVITGEGKLDRQTQFGKTPCGVARIAGQFDTPVIAVAGSIEEGAEVLFDMGIQSMISILDQPMDLEEAIKKTPRLLENTGERIARLMQTGKRLP